MGIKKGRAWVDKNKKEMERIEARKEEWVFVATDDDGTQTYMDVAGVTKELDEAAFFKIWLKHVPPPGGQTFGEIQRLLTKNKRGLGAPHHVRQVVEIDCFKGVSRSLSLVVCDKRGQVLHVIHYRFPEWSDIKEGSLLSIVKKNIEEQFCGPPPVDSKPLTLKFSNDPAAVPGEHEPVFDGTVGTENLTEVGRPTSGGAVTTTGEIKLQAHEAQP